MNPQRGGTPTVNPPMRKVTYRHISEILMLMRIWFCLSASSFLWKKIEMSNLGWCIIIGFNLLADKNGKHEHQKTNYRQAQANVCDGAHSDCKIVRQ